MRFSVLPPGPATSRQGTDAAERPSTNRPVYSTTAPANTAPGWRAALPRVGQRSTYLDPDHPLQLKCRSPHRGCDRGRSRIRSASMAVALLLCVESSRGLARAFGLLVNGCSIRESSYRHEAFPALLSSNNLNEGRFAAWWGGPVKGGAQGLIAAGRHGIGVAAKSHDGNVEIAIAAMMEVIRRVGLLSQAAIDDLVDVGTHSSAGRRPPGWHDRTIGRLRQNHGNQLVSGRVPAASRRPAGGPICRVCLARDMVDSARDRRDAAGRATDDSLVPLTMHNGTVRFAGEADLTDYHSPLGSSEVTALACLIADLDPGTELRLEQHARRSSGSGGGFTRRRRAGADG